ncbi:MFS transporter [Histoplasma capsulatum]|uniref:MFS transporter n=1 Tax=Ajellomyces capsulatus TaxID=5037 RepID=A0A8A1M4P4_AJECA|nr:MFS transporter [Histoplasma capsulatum]
MSTMWKIDGEEISDAKAGRRSLEHNFASKHSQEVLNLDVDDPDTGLSTEERAVVDRQLVRKLDKHLIPWLSFLYLLSFLDRTNIGNAKLDGLQTALRLTNTQYNATLTIFFVSYSTLEPLTNVLLKKWKPSVFIPLIMVAWGICMTCMGLVRNFSGLMAARWFLGAAESGLFPGVGYLLSCWYKRSEFGIRMAIFFSAAAFAGSFGGLLAAAIAQMDGVGGKPGWAWIFILEGLFTVVIGIISFWVVQDFPDQATFLTEADRKRVIRRLAADKQSSAAHEEFKAEYIWASVKDWKMYTSAMIYMGCNGSLYAFSLFVPTIIFELLLTVPPYAVAACLTITVGYIADRTRKRGIYNMAISLCGITGFTMLLASQRPAVKYVGTFFGAMGIYPAIPNTIAWISNNVEGVYKRGIILGFVIGWGNIQGCITSNIYRGEDRPRFYPGHATVLAYLVIFLLGGSVLQYTLLRKENRKRLRGERNYWVEGLDPTQVGMRGDKRPDFLYTL